MLKHIKHKKDTTWFQYGLVCHDTEIWTPNPKKNKHLPNFYRCVMMARMGKEYSDYPMNLNTFRNFAQIDADRFNWLIDEMELFAKAMELQIDVYQEISIIGGMRISLAYSLNEHTSELSGTSKQKKIALLHAFGCPQGWATLLPTKKGKLRILDRRYCGTCCQWMAGKGFAKHQSNCRRCACGNAYRKGDNHATLCNKNHWNPSQRPAKDRCKLYKKSPDDAMDLSTSYFADLETFTPEADGIYRCYAAGLLCPSQADEEAMTWDGMDCLDGFMNYLLEHCQGYLWFFNGGRFDCFFLIQWLLQHHVKIVDDSILVDGNTILAFAFTTKCGTLILKDACRFLPGSLDDNCRAFGLSTNQSKADFEHGKMKTVEDIDRYRGEYLPYLKLDVVALRAVISRYANVVWDSYRLHLCKFVTGAHLAYAVFTTRLPPNAPLFRIDSIKDEANIRAAYRGGRVICGRPEWRTSDCFEIIEKDDQQMLSREDYDKITDFLVYVDVNSLYPSAQVNQEYPIGKYYHNVVCLDW